MRKARQNAADTLVDVVLAGGDPDKLPAAQCLASCGKHGEHEQNVERDYHRWQQRMRQADGITLKPFEIDLALKHPKKAGETSIEKVAVLLPHEFLHCIYSLGPRRFVEAVGSDADIAEFWQHERRQPWARCHPVDKASLCKAIPGMIHGDDVMAMKFQKVCVLQWSSALSTATTFKSRFLIAVLPYNRLIPGVTLNMLFQVMNWSFTYMLLGYFPPLDPAGQQWTCKWRRKMGGSCLAGGYVVALFGHRGDCDWFAAVFRYNHYRMNDMCHKCGASKSDAETDCADLSPEAGWRDTVVTHEQYMATTPAEERSPLTETPGWRLENNFNDAMHGMHLGTAQHTAGNVLCELARAHSDPMDLALEKLWLDFKSWLQRNKLKASVAQFSKSTLSLDDSIMLFPLLKIKAACCEKVVLWLAEFTSHDSATYHLRIRHMTVWALADFFKGMKEHGRFLDDDAVARMSRAGTMFLSGYQYLSTEACRAGVPRWNIVPKFHYFAHTVDDLHERRINPRVFWCFGDEDFVGRVAKIVSRTHRSKLSGRGIERYLSHLHMMWIGVDLDRG